jgi:manganese oxidase
MQNRISIKARVGIGVLLAYGGTAWLHVLNAASAAPEALGTSVLTLLRDGTLALALVLPAVLLVLAITARLRPASRVMSVARTTVAVVAVTTAVFIAGAVGHAAVFASEHVPTAQGASTDDAIIRVGANPIGIASGTKVPTAPKPGYQNHQGSTGMPILGAPPVGPAVPAMPGMSGMPGMPGMPAGMHDAAGAAAPAHNHAAHEGTGDGHETVTSVAGLLGHGALESARVFPALLLLALLGLVLAIRRRDDEIVGRRTRRVVKATPHHSRRVVATATGGVIAVIASTFSILPTATAITAADPVTEKNGVCPAGARAIEYDLAAFSVDIPLNGWGDHMPDGMMYALKAADARVNKTKILANTKLTQPLVIRANVGDCVTLKLKNDIVGRRVGLSTQGLVQLDVKTSDGTKVGYNPDSTVDTGAERTYTWYADQTGEAPLYDNANLDSNAVKHTSIQNGLYGGVVVHPKGSTWHNQITGNDLLEGGRAVETQLFADVRSGAESTRSAVMVFGDENEDTKDKFGNIPTYPVTGLKDSTFAINYRSEPLRNRLRAILQHRGTPIPEDMSGVAKTITLPNGTVYKPADHFCDGYVPSLGKVVDDPGAKCMSEESHLQSWIFGDEGKLTTKGADGEIVTDSDNVIPKAYIGDAFKFHVVHPGAMETHPWHQHTQRWNADPKNKKSPLKDVQSFGPGEAKELNIEGGAGGVQKTVGDSIFHCHLYPHFAQGFWGHLRIFDKTRDGTAKYADGTPLEALQKLPTDAGTPAPTAEKPGFPLFVSGDVGQRAYRPPNSVVKDDFAAIRRPGDAPRGPTQLEKDGLPALDPAKPGNGYIDPCPTAAKTRTYRPHAIDVPLTYNSAGWKDRQGRIYAEEVEADAIRLGVKKDPEPYTIRARLGECVQVFTTNDLHLDDDPKVPVDHLNKLDGVFMAEDHTSEVSTHVHLVQFDELASDGTSVGWNYTSSAMPGQTFGYRWFVDVPLRTVFFHDHQYANLHQMKGLWAAMNIEPADATWHDPKTGAETNGVGTMADIHSPSGPDFREMTIHYSDRIPMWRDNGAGAPINPPLKPDNFGQNQGGYSINYKNAPFEERTKAGAAGLKKDPAYTYSSAVHKDPDTPILRAYTKDPVVIRQITGAHEEMHEFNLHGHRWLNEPDNPLSNIVDSQTGALAEWFNYEVSGGTVRKIFPGAEATLDKVTLGDMSGTPSIVAGGAGAPGDYLYGSPLLEDQWMGMWGLFRVPKNRVADLQPLPDRVAPGVGTAWPAIVPGAVNRKATAAEMLLTTPCPTGAKQVLVNVSAIAKDIVYNAKSGDHDPYGVMYARTADVAKIRSGAMKTEPLVIRASAGDCLRVLLKNELPTVLPVHTGDLPVPPNVPSFPRSNRVSMHPSLLTFDVTQSDGATVGYNFDQTVAPGATLLYTWYASPDLADSAAVNLLDFGDRRGHRHHGLYGSLMVEPKGFTAVNPNTGVAVTSGAQANVSYKDAAGVSHPFREAVLNVVDGLVLRDKAGQILAYPLEGEPGDVGHRAINYRTERFAPRLLKDPDVANVMSSTVHGDPETPLIRAYAGDNTHVRLISGGDRDRAHTFILSGHSWHDQNRDPNSAVRTSQGGLLTGGAFSFNLIGGAGGRQGLAGDYLYRDGNLNNQVNQGLWGILRVEDSLKADLKVLQ